MQPCPCGSGLTMLACCGRFLDAGAVAPTAEALMRSRYVAFVLQREDYLLKTWDPEMRPPSIAFDQVRWLGLQVLVAHGGPEDMQGEVEFVTAFAKGKQVTRLHEKSHFLRTPEGWLYHRGDCRWTPVGRNEACPCGSGKKLKRCCLA